MAFVASGVHLYNVLYNVQCTHVSTHCTVHCKTIVCFVVRLIKSSLLQFDANLIEGEPYNHLAWKNKRQLKWRDKIQIYQKCGKPISKPAKTNSVTVDPSPVWSTQRFFAPARPPVGQKTSLVNFKHKINTSANYMDGIGTGCTSHNKEMCLHSKRLEYNFKINQ